MASSAAIAEDVSIAGTTVVCLLLLAQLPAMYTVITKTKSVAHLSVAPTVAQMANFVSWVVYALFGNIIAVLRVNVIGVAFGIGYLTVFFVYARGRQWWALVYFSIAATLAFGAIFAGIIVPTSLTNDTKVLALGYVALVCNVVMFAGPIAQLVRAGAGRAAASRASASTARFARPRAPPPIFPPTLRTLATHSPCVWRPAERGLSIYGPRCNPHATNPRWPGVRGPLVHLRLPIQQLDCRRPQRRRYLLVRLAADWRCIHHRAGAVRPHTPPQAGRHGCGQ